MLQHAETMKLSEFQILYIFKRAKKGAVMAVAGLRSTDSFEKYLDLTGKKPSTGQGLPRSNGEIQLFSDGKIVEPEKGGSSGVRRTSETNTGAAAGSANAPVSGTGTSDPMSMNGSVFNISPDGGVTVPVGPNSNPGVGSVLGASGINQPDGTDSNAPQGGATGGNQRGGATAGGSQNGVGTVNDMLYSLYEQAIREAKDAEAAGGGIFGADVLGNGPTNIGGAEGTGGTTGSGGAEGTNPQLAPSNNPPVDDTGDVPDDGTKPNNDNKPEDDSNNTSKGINNQEEKRVEQERLEAEERRRLEAQKNDEE